MIYKNVKRKRKIYKYLNLKYINVHPVKIVLKQINTCNGWLQLQ